MIHICPGSDDTLTGLANKLINQPKQQPGPFFSSADAIPVSGGKVCFRHGDSFAGAG